MPTITTERIEQEQEIIEAVSDTIANINDKPEAAKATFSASSRLEEGFRAEVEARKFTFVSDEPEDLGGRNAGPNPVEYVLGALAACQELVIKTHAGQLGIDVESVEVTVEGNIDLQGFFGVDDDVRPGFENISYQTVIETDEEDPEKLETLKKRSIDNCPVLDIIQNPTPVNGELHFTSKG